MRFTEENEPINAPVSGPRPSSIIIPCKCWECQRAREEKLDAKIKEDEKRRQIWSYDTEKRREENEQFREENRARWERGEYKTETAQPSRHYPAPGSIPVRKKLIERIGSFFALSWIKLGNV
jgi:hypothetical protein